MYVCQILAELVSWVCRRHLINQLNQSILQTNNFHQEQQKNYAKIFNCIDEPVHSFTVKQFSTLTGAAVPHQWVVSGKFCYEVGTRLNIIVNSVRSVA